MERAPTMQVPGAELMSSMSCAVAILLGNPITVASTGQVPEMRLQTSTTVEDAKALVERCPQLQVLCLLREDPARLDWRHLQELAPRPLSECTVEVIYETCSRVNELSDANLELLMAKMLEKWPKPENPQKPVDLTPKGSSRLLQVQRVLCYVIYARFTGWKHLPFWNVDTKGRLFMTPDPTLANSFSGPIPDAEILLGVAHRERMPRRVPLEFVGWPRTVRRGT